MSRPVPYLTAVATGVIGAAWTSGAIAGLSIIGCPAALDFPRHLSAGVWRGLYEHGFAAMPKFAATTAAVYLYAAFEGRRRTTSGSGGGKGNAFLGFVAAAALTVSIVPFTIALMSETNRELLLAAGDTSPQQATERIVELIGTWKALNLGRSLLPLAGAVVGAMSFFTIP
ncbi:Noranthrone monooxygenase like protein [Verticillium longisporum]|uniref:Noranthrone monooxygenase like protein n=1 Tax=Verticillium longisporum TaxID=100787 RepID=A0A8I2Z3N9_VERLO|nr:Noranthrone monooxygenase like protein [Verticillium longisporum]